MCTLMPAESGKLVASLARDVFIEKEGVTNLSLAILDDIKAGKIRPGNFSQAKHHPKPDDPKAIDWIFVLDTLNFSFWPDKGKTKWTVNGETGYFALCAAVKRAIDEGKPIWDPHYYSQLTRQEAEVIFRGDNDSSIPLLEERLSNLHEAGKVLLVKYDGTFARCVESSKHSAVKLLGMIIDHFPSYRDEAEYNSANSKYRVGIYKRAQILVADIWSCFEGRELGLFHDINRITMFADYRIPQVLLHFGALRYSNVLMNKLRSGELLEQGSREEVEIRACSIEVIQQVYEEIRRGLAQSDSEHDPAASINAIMIDHFLWDYRREHAEELEYIPFHKTRTIYY